MAERDDDTRMSPFEAMMWEVDSDPHLASSFSNLTILDRPPDRAVLRAKLNRATVVVGRLRQRVVPTPGRLAPPEWRDDPEFDLDHHVRWVDLGGNADHEELCRFAVRTFAQPFDRERPLWEFVVVEGLEGGRAAMVQRFHHTIADGKGGIRISAQFLDLEAHPAEPDEPAAIPPLAPSTTDPVDPESWWARNSRAFGHATGQVRDVAGSIGQLLTRPGDLPARGAELADMARSAARQIRVDSRRSPLWTERSLDRWFGTTKINLDDVRTAASALGGSINDLFVTGAVDGAARHHEAHGAPVAELRLSMPISTRDDKRVGGNAFTPSQTLVPTGPMDVAERFRAIHEALDVVKREHVTSVDAAAVAANLLPRAAIVRTTQMVTGSVDFVVSNVKAAPFDLYIAGAFMEANYPLGPLAGTAFNLTTMSYRGWLFLGLVADTAAIADPDVLLGAIENSYRELLKAGGVKRRTVKDPRLTAEVS